MEVKPFLYINSTRGSIRISPYPVHTHFCIQHVTAIPLTPVHFILQFWLPKYISGLKWLAWAFLFSLSCDLQGSFCPWEVSVRTVVSRQFPQDLSEAACKLFLSRAGSILLDKSHQSSPARQKAVFPGCFKTPLNMALTTVPLPTLLWKYTGRVLKVNNPHCMTPSISTGLHID